MVRGFNNYDWRKTKIFVGRRVFTFQHLSLFFKQVRNSVFYKYYIFYHFSYKWFRKTPIHVGLKNYFSTKLIKTSELHTGQNYLLAAYPHTVTPMNTLINFLSEANNIAEVFPLIDFCGVSHDAVFFIPLLRELMLAIGELLVLYHKLPR